MGKISTETKFFLIVALIIIVLDVIEMFRNQFYSPYWILLVGLTFMILVWTMFGTKFPRLAPPLVLDLTEDQNKLGIYGRYAGKFSLPKMQTAFVLDVPNYILMHLGRAGEIRGIRNIIRGDTPIIIQDATENFLSLSHAECALPEGLIIRIGKGSEHIFNKKLLNKIDMLSFRLYLTAEALGEIEKLAKSLEQQFGADILKVAEKIGKVKEEISKPLAERPPGFPEMPRIVPPLIRRDDVR